MTTTKITFRSVNEIYPIFGDGKYQFLSIFAVCLAMVPVGMQQYAMVFIALQPPWTLVNSSLIHVSTDDEYDGKCELDERKWRWLEEKDYSVISEFDIHCTKESLLPTTLMSYFAFGIAGSFFWGYVSDRYGRQKAIFFATSFNVICSLINAYSINLPMFVTSRVVSGFFAPSLMMVIVVYAAEIVSEKKRTLAGMCVWCFYTFGALILSLVSRFERNWRHILFYGFTPMIAVVILLWFLPESIAWDFNKRHCKRVKNTLDRICKMNGREAPICDEIYIEVKQEKSQVSTLSSILLLWTPLRTAWQTVVLGFAWVSWAIGFIGLSYIANDFTGHVYRDFAIINASEIIACVFAITSSSRFGHKRTVLSSMILGGVVLFVVASVPDTKKGLQIMRLVFGVLGKVFVTIVADSIGSWTAETYPTFLRSTASGFHQACSFIGMMIVPWTVLWLRRYHEQLPFFCMAGVLIMAAVPLIKIPETQGSSLTETFRNNGNNDNETANEKTELKISTPLTQCC